MLCAKKHAEFAGGVQMKKLASVVLASAMAVVPFAAGLAATFTPGEYEASAQGFGGAVTVKVTVDD